MHVCASAGVYESSVEKLSVVMGEIRTGPGEFFYLELTQFQTSKWVNSKEIRLPKPCSILNVCNEQHS